ncbi:MAG: glycosyltransferase family 2 protein [Geminicoccaceae bacterium]
MSAQAQTGPDPDRLAEPAGDSQTLSPQTVPDLSFVIPAFNEAANIATVVESVAGEATRLVDRFEILVIDDGSRDQTFNQAKDLATRFPVRAIRLSRNFGKEQAIMAGLERASGAAVVVIDADLQEPISYLESMLRHYRDGFEMVYAVRAHRKDESYLKRLLARAFYRLLSYGSDVAIPANARDFRLMDRRVVDALCALPERNRFMKGLYGWVGFRSKAIPIMLEEREGGASKFGMKNLIQLGLTGLTSFTDWPLRVWTAIGTMLALISIVYGFWIIAKTLIWGIDLPGFATITVAVFFLGGVQLISIGVLGEYLARVFTEVKGRPGFIVAEDVSPKPSDR